MATPSASPLELASIQAELARLRKSDEQTKRELVKIPKVPEAAPAGGIEGITRVWAWSMGKTPSATNVLAVPSGTFEITERSGVAPTVTQDGAGVTLEAGYYVVTMDYYLSISGTPPAGGRVFLDYSGAEYHFPQQVAPIVDDVVGGSADLIGSWTVGPLPVESPGSLTWGASWPGSNESVFVNYWTLDIAKVSGT